MDPSEAHQRQIDGDIAWCSCGYDLPDTSHLDHDLVVARHLGHAWLLWASEQPQLAAEARAQLRDLAETVGFRARVRVVEPWSPT